MAADRSFPPPAAARAEARRALRWIAEGHAGDGFTNTGRARARDIAGGRNLSLDTIARMAAYFARHEADREADGFDERDASFPSPGRVAWAAWGGDPGRSWARKILAAQEPAADRDANVAAPSTKEHRMNLPPSYRPASSADVPNFVPACETCVYFAGNDDPENATCTRWSAPVSAESYCDAWLIDEDHMPGWLAEPEDVVEADEQVDALEQIIDGLRPDDAAEPTVEMNSADADGDVEERSILEDVERREFTSELRVQDGGTTLFGYAARWNVEADGLSFREQIAPGAFARSLREGPDPVLLVNHDDRMIPLARRSSGTLRVWEDGQGLAYEADLDPANPAAAALLSAVSRRDMEKMSFAMRVRPGGEFREDGLRTIRDADLLEISVVSWPAYSASSAGVRSADSEDEGLALRRRRISSRLALRD